MRLRVIALAIAFALIAPQAAAAASCQKTTLGDVENEVMCLVCGTPLALATEAPQANRQRAFIQRLVDDCKSKDEIKQQMVAQYGPRVLALPPQEGFNLTSYLVPIFGFLLGAGAIAAAALQWRRTRGGGSGGPGDPAPAGGPTPDKASSDRLQADLDRYEL